MAIKVIVLLIVYTSCLIWVELDKKGATRRQHNIAGKKLAVRAKLSRPSLSRDL